MDSASTPEPKLDKSINSGRLLLIRLVTLLGISGAVGGVFCLGFKSRELFTASADTLQKINHPQNNGSSVSDLIKSSTIKSEKIKPQPSPLKNNQLVALTSKSQKNQSHVSISSDNFTKSIKENPVVKPDYTPKNQQVLLTQLPQIERNNTRPSSPSSTPPKIEQFPPLNLPTHQLENYSQPNVQQPNQNSEIAGVQLSLSDVVILALQNNRELKNAYLERIIQKEDLAVAEDKFIPNFIPAINIAINRQALASRGNSNGNLGLSALVSVKIPTGGTFNFGWQGSGQTVLINEQDQGSNRGSLAQNLQLSFNQPLLRGSGIKVNQASIEIARFIEQNNILDLKLTLIDTITSVILNYRNLILAQEQLKIEQDSLEIAQKQLERLQALIDAGRRARVDILPSQTNIANRQVSLLAAENNLEKVRLELLQVLDLDETFKIIAVEDLVEVSQPLEISQLKQLAYQNNPQYLKSQLNIEVSKLNLLVAQDNRRWDLDFNASYGNLGNTLTDDITDMTVGIDLSRDFGDRTLKQDYQQSRVRLLQAENSLIEQQETLEIQVRDRLRDVNLKLRQVELAGKARELAERQLEIEQEKLKLGQSNIIDVVNFQNDLAQAKNAELNARIDYANALTNLEQTVGITLETWKVTVEVE